MKKFVARNFNKQFFMNCKIKIRIDEEKSMNFEKLQILHKSESLIQMSSEMNVSELKIEEELRSRLRHHFHFSKSLESRALCQCLRLIYLMMMMKNIYKLAHHRRFFFIVDEISHASHHGRRN